LASPSPRDIEEVRACFSNVEFVDQLFVKYYPEYLAYQLIQEQFLSADYTHLILAPDDLTFTRENLIRLLQDVKDRNFDVIGGVCNVDLDWNDDRLLLVTDKVVPLKRENKLRYFEHIHRYYAYNGKLRPEFARDPILRTVWQGFPLTCIKRSVLEIIKLRTDAEFNDLDPAYGCCVDDVFSWDLLQNNIASYTDLRIRTKHLKKNKNNARLQPIKNKNAYFKLEKAKEPMPELTTEISSLRV